MKAKKSIETKPKADTSKKGTVKSGAKKATDAVATSKTTYTKPKEVKSIKLPQKPIPNTTVGKVVLLLTEQSYENIPNVVKYNPLDFTSWTTFERELRKTHDVAILDDLYLTQKGTFSTLPKSGEKVGYVLVEKDNAFKYVGGGIRLTAPMVKNVRYKLDVELALINKKVQNLLETAS